MLFLASLLAVAAAQTAKPAPHHSLNAPFRAGGQQNFWHISGGGQFYQDYARLTPDKQSRTGLLWNEFKTTMTDWEVELDFSVVGKKSYGGDGFAFWFTEQKGLLGHVFGSADYWKGLAIVFDSYNNDGTGDHPLIAAFDNDGTQSYDSAMDGGPPLASCGMPFRNKEGSAKIRYVNGLLSVEISLGKNLSPTDVATPVDNAPAVPPTAKNFRKCFEVEIELGIDKYFGITAHTGDVADAHDVQAVRVVDLTPPDADLNMVRERYRSKIEKDFKKANHETLTANEFQHLALNLLHQNQEGLQMVEDLLNQVNEEQHARARAMMDELNELGENTRGTGSSPPPPPSGGQPSHQSDSTHEWHRQTGDRLAETKRIAEQVQQTLNSLQNQGTSVDRSVQNQIKAMAAQMDLMRGSVSAVQREVADQQQGGGGEGWLNTILLVVITILLIVQMVGGRGKSGGGGGYGKLV